MFDFKKHGITPTQLFCFLEQSNDLHHALFLNNTFKRSIYSTPRDRVALCSLSPV